MKNKLFSIGEMAKLTQASIQSLRYYEQIKLLEPAFTDPDSHYRYYSFDQKCLIELIQICVELGIPLSTLGEFISAEDTVNFSALLAHGQHIAKKKLARLEKALHFIDQLGKNIAPTGQDPFYTRFIEEKYICLIPCRKPILQITPYEMIRTVLKGYYDQDDYAEQFHYGLVDIGMLSHYQQHRPTHYIFTALPKNIAESTSATVMTIPAGEYCCTQSETRQIEKAPQIFADYLQGNGDFLAMETDVFTQQYQVNRLVNELRVVAYPAL